MGMFTFRGVPASGGVGIGRIYLIENSGYEKQAGKINKLQPDEEIGRLEKALARTLEDINKMSSTGNGPVRENEAGIFNVYKLMLEDIYFIDELRKEIKENRVSAEEAVEACFRKYVSGIIDSGNSYMAQRVYDFNSIGQRIKENLCCTAVAVPTRAGRKHIAVVRELTPLLAVDLARRGVTGVLASEGAGYLSHSVIILKAYNIPTLNCVDFEAVRKFSGSKAIIDAEQGILIIEPDRTDIRKYRQLISDNFKRLQAILEEKTAPAFTLDGNKFSISANISNLEEYNIAARRGIEGVGLIRTEILFLNGKKRILALRDAKSLIMESVLSVELSDPIRISILSIG